MTADRPDQAYSDRLAIARAEACVSADHAAWAHYRRVPAADFRCEGAADVGATSARTSRCADRRDAPGCFIDAGHHATGVG